MSIGIWIIVAIVAIAVVGVLWFAISERRRTQRRSALREQFGPEYDRAIGDVGDVRRGESELEARRQRREQLDIRPLPAGAAERYSRRWEQVQARFVDDPTGALREADEILAGVMRSRGYPVEDLDQREADLSVDHADVVEHYREGHGVWSRLDDDPGPSTEDVRQAFVHYRELFAALVEPPEQGDRATG